MASVRLTSILRERILKNLLEHRFGKQQEVNNARSQILAKYIYNEIFSEDDIALMAVLPNGWLDRSSHIHVTISGQYESLCLGSELLFPANKLNRCVAVYDGGTPVADEWAIIQNEQDNIYKQKKEAKYAASAVLDSVTMTGALIAKWPEVAPYLPEESVPETLPSLPLDCLNEMLALEPVKKVKAA